jgi:hypothetical protein
MSTLSAVMHAHPLLVPHPKRFHAIDAARAMFHAAAKHERPERIYYPPTLNFLLENAAMAREMRRL